MEALVSGSRLLYSAGQQANEAVQDQLSALTFTKFVLTLLLSIFHLFLKKIHCVYPYFFWLAAYYYSF